MPDGLKTEGRPPLPVPDGVSGALPPNGRPGRGLFIGQVDELRGVMGGGRREGEVVLSLLVGEEMVRARPYLDAQQYEVANSAHMSGRPVRLEGVFGRDRSLPNLIVYSVSGITVAGTDESWGTS